MRDGFWQRLPVVSLTTKAVIAQYERYSLLMEDREGVDHLITCDTSNVALITALAGSLIGRVKIEKIPFPGILEDWEEVATDSFAVSSKNTVSGHELCPHGLWLRSCAALIRRLVEFTIRVEPHSVLDAADQKIKKLDGVAVS